MIFVWGRRMFGKVDRVPGHFHVATMFGHFQFLPLIPMSTYLVLESAQGPDDATMFEIPLCPKSIRVAWARAITVFVAIVTSILAISDLAQSRPIGSTEMLALFSLIAFVALRYLPQINHAEFERACELAEHARLPKSRLQEIYELYGQATDRSPANNASENAWPDEQKQLETYYVEGTHTKTGQAACISVWAEDDAHARKVGADKGLVVTKVEPVNPKRRWG